MKCPKNLGNFNSPVNGPSPEACNCTTDVPWNRRNISSKWSPTCPCGGGWTHPGSFGSHKTLVESPTEATNVLELLTLHNKALFPVDLPWIQTIPKTPLGNTGKKPTQTCLHHLIFLSFHADVLECPTL